MPASGDGKGKSSKIGRNKVKCERYRFRKGNPEGNKKPRGIGNRTRPTPEPGFIEEAAMMRPKDFERLPAFRPLTVRAHIIMEYIERGENTPGENGRRLIEAGESMIHPLRDPRMHCHVRCVPRKAA